MAAAERGPVTLVLPRGSRVGLLGRSPLGADGPPRLAPPAAGFGDLTEWPISDTFGIPDSRPRDESGPDDPVAVRLA
jgi:hypothetical protein